MKECDFTKECKCYECEKFKLNDKIFKILMCVCMISWILSFWVFPFFF